VGLEASRVRNSVHPWLAERLLFLEQIADFYGGRVGYSSGFRTVDRQAALFRQLRGIRPVARPGCSQHQYGFAADLFYIPPVEFGAEFMRNFTNLMEDFARQLGLRTVAGDPGHLQVFPGSEFREWAQSWDICPDPSWREVPFTAEERCLNRGGTWARTLFGSFCEDPLEAQF